MQWVKSLVDKVNSVPDPGSRSDNVQNDDWRSSQNLIQFERAFSDFMESSNSRSPKFQPDEYLRYRRLSSLFPVFNQEFQDCPPDQLMIRFSNVYSFAFHSTKYLVSKITQFAGRKSITKNRAAKDVFDFLSSEEGKHNLKVLYLLTKCQDNVIEEMAEAQLVGTLIKTMFLFLNLPQNIDGLLIVSTQKSITLTLGRLTQRKPAINKLLGNDQGKDFMMLWKMAKGKCNPWNLPWAKGGMEVLSLMFKKVADPRLIAQVVKEGYVAQWINRQWFNKMDLLRRGDIIMCLTNVVTGSTSVSQALNEEFKLNDGYEIMKEVLRDLETDKSVNKQDRHGNISKILNSTVDFCYSGTTMLAMSRKRYKTNQDASFYLPTPRNAGFSLRNLNAFGVLHSFLLSCEDKDIVTFILTAIFQVISADHVNYFILEDEFHPLTNYLKLMPTFSVSMKALVLKIYEVVMYSINYIPYEELKYMAVFLNDPNLDELELILKFVRKFLNLHSKYAQVFFETDIFDALLNIICYHARTSTDFQFEGTSKIGDTITFDLFKELYFICDQMITLHEQSRAYFRNHRAFDALLSLLHQCNSPSDMTVLTTGFVRKYLKYPIDDVKRILGGLFQLVLSQDCYSTASIEFLNTICRILEILTFSFNSSTVPTAFREVGGFVFIINVLLRLKKKFPSDTDAVANNVEADTEVDGLVIAGSESGPEDVERLKMFLQLFINSLNVLAASLHGSKINEDVFLHEIGYTALYDVILKTGMMNSNESITVFNALIHFATQSPFPVTPRSQQQQQEQQLQLKKFSSSQRYEYIKQQQPLQPLNTKSSSSLNSLNVSCSVQELNSPIVAGKDIRLEEDTMRTLFNGYIPSVILRLTLNVSKEIQVQVFQWLLLISSIEYNQQILASSSFIETLCEIYSGVFSDLLDWKHSIIITLYQSIACHCISSNSLKKILRVQNSAEQEVSKELLKMLSRTTQRFEIPIPDFIEFDLRRNGAACLFIPFHHPKSFPFASYSFTCWFYVDQWGERGSKTSLRLFSLKDSNTEYINAVINQDHLLQLSVHDSSVVFDKFKFNSKEWYHMSISHARYRMKPSEAVLYINGIDVQSAKIKYFQVQQTSSPTSGASNPSSSGGKDCSDIACIIGTKETEAEPSSLVWRLGPTYFHDEQLTSTAVATSYFVGPRYRGCFQSDLRYFKTHEIFNDTTYTAFCEGKIGHGDKSIFDLSKTPTNLKNLDQLVFFVHPANHMKQNPRIGNIAGVSESTRTLFSEVVGSVQDYDSDKLQFLLNGKEKLLSTKDVTVPLSLYGDVRLFSPCPFVDAIRTVGGMSVIIRLVEKTVSSEALLSVLELLCCCVRYNAYNSRQMEKIQGYQMLAFLFKKKHKLLTTEIVTQLFRFVGLPGPDASGCLINTVVLDYVILDFDIWRKAPLKVQKSVLQNLYGLIKTGTHAAHNLQVLNESRCLQRLLYILCDESVSEAMVRLVIILIQNIVELSNYEAKLLDRTCAFLALYINSDMSRGDDMPSEISSVKMDPDLFSLTPRKLMIRNLFLEMLQNFVAYKEKFISDKVLQAIQFPRLLMFFGPHLNSESLILAFRLLVSLIQQSSSAYSVFKNNLQGFSLLKVILPPLASSSQLHFILLGLMLGRNVSEIPYSINLDLPTVHNFFPEHSKQEYTIVSPEAMQVLFDVIRSLQRSWLHLRKKEKEGLLESINTLKKDTAEKEAEAGGKPPTDDDQKLNSVDSNLSSTSITDLNRISTPPSPAMRKMRGGSIFLEVNTDKVEALEIACSTLLSFMLHVMKRSPHHLSLFTKPESLDCIVAVLFPDVNENKGSVLDSVVANTNKRFSSNNLKSGLLTATGQAIDAGKKLSKWLTGPATEEVVGRITRKNTITGSGEEGAWFAKAPSGDSLPAEIYQEELGDEDLLEKESDDGFEPDDLFECLLSDYTFNILKAVMLNSLVRDTKSNIIETILESPPVTTSRLYQAFQSTILLRLGRELMTMNYNEILNATSFPNFSKYAHLLSDLHLTGQLVGVSHFEVCQIIIYLLQPFVKGLTKGSLKVQLSFPLFRCLYRVLLDIFDQGSRSDQPKEGANIIDNLTFIKKNQKTFFHPEMNEKTALCGLTHYLFKLLLHDDSDIRKVSHSVFKILIRQKSAAMEEILKHTRDNGEVISIHDEMYSGFLLQNELMVFQNWLVDKDPIIKEIMNERISCTWRDFVANDQVARVENVSLIQKQRIIHLRKKTSKDRHDVQTLRSSIGEAITRVQTTQRSEKSHYARYRHRYFVGQSHVVANANRLLKNLNTGRGLYGDAPSAEGNGELRWMLDSIEGPDRMRRRMCPNPNFDHNKNRKKGEKNIKKIESGESQEDLNKTESSNSLNSTFSLTDGADATSLFRTSTTSSTSQARKEMNLYSMDSDHSANDDDDDDDDHHMSKEERKQSAVSIGSVELEENPDRKKDMFQLLEPGDKALDIYACARIQGIDVTDSVLVFSESNFYIFDGYCLVLNGGSGKYEMVPTQVAKDDGVYQEIVPSIAENMGSKNSDNNQETATFKCTYDDLLEVHKRRYLLQNIALELFSNDGRDHLLAFKKDFRDLVYTKLMQKLSVSEEGSVSRTEIPNVPPANEGGLFSRLWSDKSPTQRWVNGEMSNFQYLMWINTSAGRSYNDLTQYPVFPWILKDYTSETLDLKDESIYRDFSKSMGNQTSKRAEEFIQRYDSWEDPSDEIPAFHYGTHYSSAMIVASYLIRMEPFTSIFLRLQGGSFDHPERLFHSIAESWLSASELNTADVKELIPEFYYLPEFIKNSNKFDFGTKQSGERLGDVVLPAWAKGDVHEFIRIHRAALESDYVSAHLHQWIDLVFGHKQQGELAKKNLNVFHHLSYEGSVDIDLITDPVQRRATIGIINNFGQTPSQLFKRPHPVRKTFESSSSSHIYHAPQFLMPSTQCLREIYTPIGQIAQDASLYVGSKKESFLPPHFDRSISWNYADGSLRTLMTETQKELCTYENMHLGEIVCANVSDGRTLVTAGNDTVVSVWKVSKDGSLKHLSDLYGHSARVNCIASSKPYSILVTGSEDGTCILWDFNRLTFIRELEFNCSHSYPITAVHINQKSGIIIACAGPAIGVWSVNGEVMVIESKSSFLTTSITCCTASEGPEWDSDNVIITGHRDGLIKVWRMILSNAKDDDHETLSKTDSCDMESLGGETEVSNKRILVTAPSVDKDYTTDNAPKEIFKWKLVQVCTLGRRVAYKNSHTTPVSCLSITKDNKKLLVGDVEGRVISWSLPEVDGGAADYWVRDDQAPNCKSCKASFTGITRRHHCRLCGEVFCSKCSRFQSIIPIMKIYKPVRVCGGCYSQLHGDWPNT